MIRVAITTDRFPDVASFFEDAGLEPVSTPCIRLAPATPGTLARARAAASESDLVLITSQRTVELLWPDGGMPPVDVAAVGAASAAAVISAGGRVAVTGRAGLAALVDVAADRLPAARVLLAHAAGSDPTAMQRLRALAPNLEEHVVYRVLPVGPKPVPVDAVAFASPSAVEGWHITRDLDDLVVGAVGETTAAAVARYREPDVIAPRHSHSALARALGSFLEVNV